MMIVFLVLALGTGMICAATSAILGVGLLGVFLWYSAGCWIGFLTLLAAMMALRGRQPQEPTLRRQTTGS